MESEAEKQARELAERAQELASVLTDELGHGHHVLAHTSIHSFIHCKACTLRGQTERLEAGLSRTGVVVQCKKHGLIVHFGPEQLRQWIAKGPQCDCCPGGRHRS